MEHDVAHDESAELSTRYTAHFATLQRLALPAHQLDEVVIGQLIERKRPPLRW